MGEENMVCINMLCNFNDELYMGRCTKGENEPEIYECEDSVICCEGHPIIDKISQIKKEAGEQRLTKQSTKPCAKCQFESGTIRCFSCWYSRGENNFEAA